MFAAVYSMIVAVELAVVELYYAFHAYYDVFDLAVALVVMDCPFDYVLEKKVDLRDVEVAMNFVVVVVVVVVETVVDSKKKKVIYKENNSTYKTHTIKH